MRKINIKIEGQQKPFEYQIPSMQTFATLKNRLYLTHQKIVDMYPYINGKTQITPITSGVFDTLYKNPEFVYLNFRSKNPVASAALQAKTAGLSDQSMKADYLKNFSNLANESLKTIKTQEKLKKVELSEPGKNSGTSFRITDLTHQQLMNLFNILKIQNGRYMDQKMQIITSNKQALQYNIKQADFSYIIQDKGVSHFFQNQRITQITKQVYEQGFKDKQLRNKVPYLFAFAYQEQEDYSQFEKNIQKIDNTYVEHCFPRGEVNLLTVQISPQPEMLSYFAKFPVTYETVLEFYRNYGQFLIKKFTVGLKRFCSQKITNQIQAKSTQQAERLATMAAGRIRQYMLESTNQFAKGEKKGQTNIKSDQQLHYDIKAIGGAIEYCENVTQWKESVNLWQLWRIITVNQVQRIQVLLPFDIQQKIQKVMTDHINQIKQKLNVKKSNSLVLAPKLQKMKSKVTIESNFQTICTFKEKIYQILSQGECYLILIFLDKAIRFDLTKMQEVARIQFRDPTKCFYERQPGYITACMHNYEVFIATQYGIVRLNFDNMTIKLVAEGNWRQSTLLISYKNKLYSNGFRGIYQINTKTGQYFAKIGGDWRFYTGTCIKNNLYMFYWNIYCLDLDSMIYSKVSGGLWNQFWGDFTYPTNDGLRIWQLYRNTLYCLKQSTYYPVEFTKNSVAIGKFSSRTLCYKDGFLYLSNFDQNQHLMRIPV